MSNQENQRPATETKPAIIASGQVPDSWRLVVSAQKGEIQKLTAADGYLVWLERRLIDSTRRFRAQAFQYHLYRMRAGGPKATVVHSSQGTKPPYYVVGVKGVVVVRDTVDMRLLKPGGLPQIVDNKNADGSYDLPVAIFEREWLCNTRFGSKDGITWMPAKAWKPRHRQRVEIVPWKEAAKSGDSLFRSTMLSNQNFVCYTKWPLKDNGYPGKPLGVVWAQRNKTESFTIPGSPLGIDKNYVYLAPHDPAYLFAKVRRRKLEQDAPVEESRLPYEILRLIAFRAPILVGLCKGEKSNFVARFDLSRRKMTTYDRFAAAVVSMTADGTEGGVYVATEKAIYRLTPLKTSELGMSAVWKRVPKPKK